MFTVDELRIISLALAESDLDDASGTLEAKVVSIIKSMS